MSKPGQRSRSNDLVDGALQGVILRISQRRGRGDADDRAPVCERGGQSREAIAEPVKELTL